MITVESIIDRVDDVLATGRSDARYHVTTAMRLRGHAVSVTEVDDLEAHEIYEATLAGYEALVNLSLHGVHHGPGWRMHLIDLEDNHLGIQRP